MEPEGIVDLQGAYSINDIHDRIKVKPRYRASTKLQQIQDATSFDRLVGNVKSTVDFDRIFYNHLIISKMFQR